MSWCHVKPILTLSFTTLSDWLAYFSLVIGYVIRLYSALPSTQLSTLTAQRKKTCPKPYFRRNGIINIYDVQDKIKRHKASKVKLYFRVTCQLYPIDQLKACLCKESSTSGWLLPKGKPIKVNNSDSVDDQHHPRQRVKAKWNSDFRFGGKSAAASNKASHAASKSLLFSFVLDTFQAISVIFFNSTGTLRRISDLWICW